MIGVQAYRQVLRRIDRHLLKGTLIINKHVLKRIDASSACDLHNDKPTTYH